ncbi:hypothetical protein F3Y22_tig00111621pilonHSYRG00386 [Hibiscus syriacus]|uniref:Protein BZR1 homolog n=1 Tax=Hibiscus syriacus TaxID=106335 RepID=A0A6A2YJB4_HIBSY|nr:hypothetical protein F3Y22_tig00111621pilonHSYRG00386 [Hibiscus syriacus]
MESHRPPHSRRTRGVAATAKGGADAVKPTSTPSGPVDAISLSYFGKEKHERENEKERTKLRKRNRRAYTRRMLAGLRQFGNFHLSEHSNMNDVLAALAREAGRSGESPLSTGCSTSDCQPPVVRTEDNGMSSSQGGKQKVRKNSIVQASSVFPIIDFDHDRTKESTTKGYSYEKFSEVTKKRRNGFQNWSKDDHPRIGNGIRNGCYTIFIDNLPETIHWKRLGSIFGSHGQVIDAFIPKKRNSKGVRFGFIRYATIEEARIAISKMNVEGVVDEDKLQVLSNCLVGWCKNFIKLGNLANQIQVKGLAGFTLMRVVGNVVLMVFEDSDSLRSVKDDKLETLAEWFSRVETWSESLAVECRLVWLVCEGIPFHAWNWDTFKNIATKWGKLIAIDNSCEFPSSFDRAKIQILTNVKGRIDEVLELKVGDNLFNVLVHEVDPSFKPSSWVPEDCDISLDLVPPSGS